MLPRIERTHSIKAALQYCEHKIALGMGKCLFVSGFLEKVEDLSIHDKLKWMENRLQLNERSRSNTVHISLNFHPNDAIPENQLKNVCREYMDLIGFGKQPYVVYQHFDAAHPHVHIVSVLVKEDGELINMEHLPQKKSEPGRKYLEQKYALYDGISPQEPSIKYENNYVRPVKYGEQSTKRSISEVIDKIISNHNYTSFNEYNALLMKYNVFANQGKPGSAMNQNRGLVYHIIDQHGRQIGRAVPAGKFHIKPTVDFLEKKFQNNLERREEFVSFLKIRIDRALNRQPSTLHEFKKELLAKEVDLQIRQFPKYTGKGLSLIYMDNRNLSSIEAPILGEKYTMNGLMEHWQESETGRVSMQMSPYKKWIIEKEMQILAIPKLGRLDSKQNQKLDMFKTILPEIENNVSGLEPVWNELSHSVDKKNIRPENDLQSPNTINKPSNNKSDDLLLLEQFLAVYRRGLIITKEQEKGFKIERERNHFRS